MRSKASSFRSVKIISNPQKQWAQETAEDVAEFLPSASFEVVEKNADVTICIGGDGTILFANHQGKIEGAVLGIGGERSVVCQLRKDSWKENLDHILKNGKIERRLVLSATAGEKTYTAINDFVVHSKDYRVIWLDIEINGERHRFEADGIIVSTPTGSFAYAYSAGGKKLNLRSRKIEIVPICSYKREFKPMVLPNSASVTISAERDVGFVVDGIFIRDLGKDEKVSVKAGGYIEFVGK